MEDRKQGWTDKPGEESRKMIKKFIIRVNGKEYKVEVEGIEGGVTGREDTKRPNGEEEVGKEGIEPNKETGKIVFAPMPAKVIRVNCKKGERVRKGDILIILEAMKMENEIISPIDGAIKEVGVKEGVNVSQNEPMLEFE